MDDIERIAEEYRKFSVKRCEMIDFIKDTHNTMLSNMEEFVLPSIYSLLISTGKVIPDDPLTCKYCNSFKGKTKSSLAGHVRKCKMNPKSQHFEKFNQIQPIEEVELEM